MTTSASTTWDAREEQRAARLRAEYPALDAAVPSAEVRDAAGRPGTSLASMVATLLDGYADRPALGRRAQEVVTDPSTGRTSAQLRPGFETVTYGELAGRVAAVAAQWQASGIRAGDAVGILGFTSVDYATLELACFEYGTVLLPLPSSASVAQLTPIVEETRARLLAASTELLDRAVDVVLGNPSVTGVVVLDHRDDVDESREAVEDARRRLADAGRTVTVEPLADVLARGATLPAAPLHEPGDGEDPLAMLIYTSGSTGTPKGAMYPESLVRSLWDHSRRVATDVPVVGFNYMPMSHLAGQGSFAGTLVSGGTGYFTASSDLSTLFEDLAAAAPTELLLVPRVCDMLYQRYRSELDRRDVDPGRDPEADAAVKAWVHEELLGGRLVHVSCGTAPLSDGLQRFVEECVGLRLHIDYGATEDGVVLRDGWVQRPPVIDYRLVDVPDLGYFATDSPHPRGELLVRTESAVPGYYRRADATAEVFDAEGYYHTGDVVAEIEPDHLAYVDRRTNVLKLAQGEFVAVSNLEAIYVESPLVRQIFVYGNSERSYLLAVVVPDAEASSAPDPSALRGPIRDSLRTVAAEHDLESYEIPRDVIVETEPFSHANGLLSDARKLLRPRLVEAYGERLEALYAELAGAQDDQLRDLRRHGDERPTLETVTGAARAMLELSVDTEIDPGARFVDLGGDSLSALSFSQLLSEIFGVDVPVADVIGPTGELASLARQIDVRRRAGGQRPTAATVHGAGVTEVRAQDLTLDAFLDEATITGAGELPRAESEPRTVLVTGATGYLGRFLCLDWLERLAPVGGTVVCLVRAPDAESARARLDAAFDRGDAELSAHYRRLAATGLEVLPGDIGEPDLGLDAQQWQRLAAQVDRIVHPAALVNHVLPYDQLFGPNVVGTAELIRMALTTRVTPITYLSTVAVVAADTDDLDEDADIRVASPVRALDGSYANGYATSKWAGEVLLREANERCELPVTVLRSDMILAHPRWTGQLNVPDMFTRLLFSVAATGLAPSSFYSADGTRPRAHYDGLPADFTAQAVDTLGGQSTKGFATFNLLNPHADGISLDTIVDWLAELGIAITRIDDHAEWFSRFSTALRGLPEEQRAHSMLPLLSAVQRPGPPVDGSAVPAERFRNAVREAGLGPDGDIPHLSADLVATYVADLRALGLL